ncbi:hypothetical protein ACHHYP_06044 [Achlya hypogyna]|uniref:Uncharacterized protein n=1 Tax=Achlya hypogyna TaxID=1202772 RepID=A0A1V9YVR7_ACHHY|nr:hypothetical protein ACHHYP_06044 [Achlya hypogyna]
MSIDSSDQEETKSIDTVDAPAPVDKYGVPLSVKHSSQTKHEAWTYVHKLHEPQKYVGKMYTHISLLCSAYIAAKQGTREAWREALVKTATTSNVKDHRSVDVAAAISQCFKERYLLDLTPITKFVMSDTTGSA